MRTRSIRCGPTRGGIARVAGALAIAVAGPLAGPAGASALQFAPTASYQIGAGMSPDQSGALRSGDFNGDGIPDLAVAAESFTAGTGGQPAQLSGGVQILLGHGDGTFAVGPLTPIAGGASAVVVGDFNGDRRLDLGVSQGSGGVAVLLGRGDGTFDPPLAGAATALQPAVGDFNGDGFDDLVAYEPAGFGDSDRLLLGAASGAPAAGPSLAGGSSVSCPATGDLNGDGKLDLVCTAEPTTGAISVLLGHGDGTFGPPITTASGLAASEAVAVGDVNGDGHPDVVVAASGPSANHVSIQQVSVLLGRGDGTLGAPLPAGLPDRESFIDGQPALADFNGDGKLDILVPGWPASVLLGGGDGSFQPPLDLGVYNSSIGSPADAASSAVADFNGDGKPDIATLAEYQQQDPALHVYLNGQATPLQVTPSAADLGAQAIGGATWSSFAPYGPANAFWMYSGPKQQVVVRNPGDGPIDLGIATITGSDPGDFAFFDDTCSATTLAPGHACAVYVAFVPTAEGPRSATITISDAAPGSPHVIPITGVGLPPDRNGPPSAGAGAGAGAPGGAATGTASCALGARARVTGTRVTVPVTCDGPARATVTGTLLPALPPPANPGARSTARASAPAPVALAARHPARMAIHLDASDRKRLGVASAHRHRVRLRLSLVVYDAAGPHPVLTRIVTT